MSTADLRRAVRVKHNSPDPNSAVSIKDLQQLAVEWQLHRRPGFWDENRTEEALLTVSTSAQAPNCLIST